MYFSSLDYLYGLYLICKCTYTCINSSHSLYLVNKNVGTCTYIEDRRLPCESMYVPVYMCEFNFFSETTGPMKAKFMWNHNRICEETLIQMIQVICCSSLLSAPGRVGRGLLAGILPQFWPRSAGLLAGL